MDGLLARGRRRGLPAFGRGLDRLTPKPGRNSLLRFDPLGIVAQARVRALESRSAPSLGYTNTTAANPLRAPRDRPSTQDDTGKDVTHSSLPPIYTALGACGKPGV